MDSHTISPSEACMKVPISVEKISLCASRIDEDNSPNTWAGGPKLCG